MPLHARLSALAGMLLVAISVAVVGAPTASAGPGGNTLQQNEQLNPGQSLWTSNGIALTMQSDGNLVEYAPGNRAVWASNTNRAGAVLRMQSDGNLVIIAPGNVPVWDSRTGGNPGAGLELQTDGNAVVYAQGHAAKWANGVQVSVASPVSGVAGDVVRLVNDDRARRGCGPLQVDGRLQQAAQGFAADMAARGYFSHSAPAPYPATLGDRLTAVGFTGFSRAGENLGQGAVGNPQQIVQAWINSPGHLDVLKDCGYRLTGVGYDSRSGARWVQLFAG